MYLLIDAGNTRLKYACHDGLLWRHQCATTLDAFTGFDLPDGFRARHCVIANVAGAHMAEKLRAALTALDCSVEWLQASITRCGVRNAYHDTASLGVDRWAAAIAAWQFIGQECLIVSAGTATTIDYLSAEGVFQGGCILPGLSTMLESLPRNTAGLPLAQGQWQMPPRNTHDAITTGCLLAQTGAILQMAARLAPAAPILLTGGNAERLLPHLGPRAQIQPGLILDGLLCIATNGTDKTWTRNTLAG